MARFGSIVSYEDCISTACAKCSIATAEREEWRPEWLLIEDEARGGVWLHADLEKDSFGYYYKSWESLFLAVDVPQLRRMIDPHWGAYFVAA
jgi:hypothetical protein